MRKDNEDMPPLADVMDFIKELRACWAILDGSDVEPRKVMRAAVSNGNISVPAFVTPQMTFAKEAEIEAMPDNPGIQDFFSTLLIED